MGSAPPAAEGGDAVHQTLGSQRQREEGVDIFIKLHEIQSQCPDQAEPVYPPEGGGKAAVQLASPCQQKPIAQIVGKQEEPAGQDIEGFGGVIPHQIADLRFQPDPGHTEGREQQEPGQRACVSGLFYLSPPPCGRTVLFISLT